MAAAFTFPNLCVIVTIIKHIATYCILHTITAIYAHTSLHYFLSEQKNKIKAKRILLLYIYKYIHTSTHDFLQFYLIRGKFDSLPHVSHSIPDVPSNKIKHFVLEH